MAPGLAGGNAPPTAMDANAQGNGAGSTDQARTELEAVMGQIRDLGGQVAQLGAKVPSMAAEVKQIQRLLMQMRVKAAQQSPQQTPSSQELPG